MRLRSARSGARRGNGANHSERALERGVRAVVLRRERGEDALDEGGFPPADALVKVVERQLKLGDFETAKAGAALFVEERCGFDLGRRRCVGGEGLWRGEALRRGAVVCGRPRRVCARRRQR